MISSPPCTIAENCSQQSSLAELHQKLKWPRYETVDVDKDRSVYFSVSCFPITVRAEDDMELLSELFTNENYCKFWDAGVYKCARCAVVLYTSEDKWIGPCRWASFRKPADSNAIIERPVFPYNRYVCTVSEVYCGGCKLFIGHSFEDGREKGDNHPNARFRH